VGYYGISKQAFYKAEKLMESRLLSNQIALDMVLEIKKRHPMMGVKKIYHLLSEDLQKLPYKIGRDALFDLLRSHFLLVSRKRRSISTTDSSHLNKTCPNLLRGLSVRTPNQVLISDMTYIRDNGGFCYLSIVSDLYSRKILGYSVSSDLSANGPLFALKRCLSTIPTGIRSGMIHHSDQGVQYASSRYTEELKKSGINVSMSRRGNPYDNAIMERTIGILKQEYFLDHVFPNIKSVRTSVKEAIYLFNYERPHLTLGYKTPSQIYEGKTNKKRCLTGNLQVAC
jgi:putative transposase